MANSMKIVMDDNKNTTIEASEGALFIGNEDDDDCLIGIEIDRAEEFIGHIRTVVEFHNNLRQKGRKDADSHAQEE